MAEHHAMHGGDLVRFQVLFFRETNTSYYEEDSTMKSLEDIFAELDKLNEDLLKQNEETLKSVNK